MIFFNYPKVVDGHRVIKLGTVVSSGLRHLLQYIYTGRYQITTENVIQLAKAAKALRMRKFEMKCWKFIHGAVDEDEESISQGMF